MLTRYSHWQTVEASRSLQSCVVHWCYPWRLLTCDWGLHISASSSKWGKRVTSRVLFTYICQQLESVWSVKQALRAQAGIDIIVPHMPLVPLLDSLRRYTLELGITPS